MLFRSPALDPGDVQDAGGRTPGLTEHLGGRGGLSSRPRPIEGQQSVEEGSSLKTL